MRAEGAKASAEPVDGEVLEPNSGLVARTCRFRMSGLRSLTEGKQTCPDMPKSTRITRTGIRVVGGL